MKYKFVCFGVLQFMSLKMRGHIYLCVHILHLCHIAFGSMMLHVCERYPATFSWELPTFTKELGLTVVYRYHFTVRNIISKLPGTVVSYIDKRARLTNNSSTLVINDIQDGDTGFYSMSTTLANTTYEEISMVVHLAEECPPQEEVVTFNVLVLDAGTPNLVKSFASNDTNHYLPLKAPAHLDFLVRIPAAVPPVQCVMRHTSGNRSYIGNVNHSTFCTWNITFSGEELPVSNLTIELKYIAYTKGVKIIQLLPHSGYSTENDTPFTTSAGPSDVFDNMTRNSTCMPPRMLMSVPTVAMSIGILITFILIVITMCGKLIWGRFKGVCRGIAGYTRASRRQNTVVQERTQEIHRLLPLYDDLDNSAARNEVAGYGDMSLNKIKHTISRSM